MNAFEGNTISELTRLTKDSETHRGLGFILQDLRNKRNLKIFYELFHKVIPQRKLM